MTPREGKDRFLAHLAHERRSSPHTQAAYRGDSEPLVDFLEEQDEAGTVRTIDIHQLRAWLGRLARLHAPSSIARKVAAVRSWMRWMHKQGHLEKNPAEMLLSPKARRPLPTLLSVDAAARVMESPDDTTRGRRDCAILELLYGSGIRVSELAGLGVYDVDLEHGQARVLGKGNKERIVPVGKKCQAAITAYLAVRPELRHPKHGTQDAIALFLTARGVRISPRDVHALVRKHGALGSGRADLHPHALRHTCATHMLDGGADLRAIQALLGHASLSVTQKYTHLSIEQLLRVYDAAHPLARAKDRE